MGRPKIRMKAFQKTVLDRYRTHGRDLPWRKTKNPWRILVSEIMLQQTQISRVVPKYKEFLAEFPTPQTLLRASDADLFRIWQGMGYWKRARSLKESASRISRDYKGKVPETPEELQKLPGIGPYTAGAVACFAFNHPKAFIDTNIRRAYLHFFFSETKRKISDKEILLLAQKAIDALPRGVSPRDWHNALFDYGAVVLSDKSINKKSAHYAKQSKFEGSFRFFRAEAMRFLLAAPRNKASFRSISRALAERESLYAPEDILASLVKDDLIRHRGSRYSL